jgi:hypothetical protein
VCSCLRARPVSPPGFLPAVRRVVGEPIDESRVVGEPIVIHGRQFCFLETKICFLGNKNSFPRIVGNENLFPTYLIVTRPRVPPSQSCRNLRFACISSGTPPIYHILEKCTATFSSYLSLKRNPVLPCVPPSQSCRNLRFACISSGTPPIYHILEKCTATFSSYLSLKHNPVFGARAQRISRPSGRRVVGQGVRPEQAFGQHAGEPAQLTEP